MAGSQAAERAHERVVVRPSAIAGLGGFAACDIPAGAVLLEYQGARIARGRDAHQHGVSRRGAATLWRATACTSTGHDLRPRNPSPERSGARPEHQSFVTALRVFLLLNRRPRLKAKSRCPPRPVHRLASALWCGSTRSGRPGKARAPRRPARTERICGRAGGALRGGRRDALPLRRGRL